MTQENASQSGKNPSQPRAGLLQPSVLLPNPIGGTTAGFYVVMFMFAYASVISTGGLSQFLANGIGVMLFGAVAIAVSTLLTGIAFVVIGLFYLGLLVSGMTIEEAAKHISTVVQPTAWTSRSYRIPRANTMRPAHLCIR